MARATISKCLTSNTIRVGNVQGNPTLEKYISDNEDQFEIGEGTAETNAVSKPPLVAVPPLHRASINRVVGLGVAVFVYITVIAVMLMLAKRRR